MSLPETLVMTATFRAPSTPFLVLRDERARIQQYLCALLSWVTVARVGRIVFAENSGTEFDFGRIRRRLEAAGKELELLVFDRNANAAQFGKGFGEGEILEHVFRHSRLLRSTSSFYKVTGRLFVANFDALSTATTAADVFRLRRGKRPGDPSKADTRFYKCSLDLFERRLIDAYRQVDDARRVSLEHEYFARLEPLRIAEFPIPPQIVGESASNGKVYGAYDAEVTRIATEMAAFAPTSP
jgi:hypothetical protein